MGSLNSPSLQVEMTRRLGHERFLSDPLHYMDSLAQRPTEENDETVHWREKGRKQVGTHRWADAALPDCPYRIKSEINDINAGRQFWCRVRDLVEWNVSETGRRYRQTVRKCIWSDAEWKPLYVIFSACDISSSHVASRWGVMSSVTWQGVVFL